MAGYVYIGTDETKKYFKIGKTKDIDRRQKEIRHMNPTFKMLFSFKLKDTVTDTEVERYFHSVYEEKRVIGEWFDLSIDDIFNMFGGRWSREHIAEKIGRQL